jgi:hypothetical protein
MIDNDVERAGDELRAMLANMVNEPITDTIRRSGDTLRHELTESIKAETSQILRRVGDAGTATKDLQEEVETLGTRVSQLLHGLDGIRTAGATSATEVARALAALSLQLDTSASAVATVPQFVRKALASDFADIRRVSDDTFGVLKSAVDTAGHRSVAAFEDIVERLADLERKRAEDKAESARLLRGLRLQMALYGALIVLQAGGVAALVYRVFGH